MPFMQLNFSEEENEVIEKKAHEWRLSKVDTVRKLVQINGKHLTQEE